jgi:phage repressor protein C with HTH and peptisase S24 domain
MTGISSKLLFVIGKQSINQWARDHDLPPQTVHEWIKNDRTPRESALKDLATKTGTSVSWWEDTVDDAPYLPQQPPNFILEESDTGMNVIEYIDEAQQNIESCLLMQIAKNAIDHSNVGKINPSHIKTIAINTDALRPTFKSGEQALIDTSCNQIVDDGVYAIKQGAQLRIKSIKLRLDGQVEVKNQENQGFAPEIYNIEAAKSFNIIGKLLPYRFGKTDR